MAKAPHRPKANVVGIRELRAHLSRWLDAVEEGEEILVTDRGKPIALIGPISSELAEPDDKLARLVMEGIVTPAKRPKTRIRVEDLIPVEGNVSDTVIRQRR